MPKREFIAIKKGVGVVKSRWTMFWKEDGHIWGQYVSFKDEDALKDELDVYRYWETKAYERVLHPLNPDHIIAFLPEYTP